MYAFVPAVSDRIGFVEAARKMREAQKDYFRTRSMRDLARAKTLEKRVDDMLASLEMDSYADYEHTRQAEIEAENFSGATEY